MNRREDGTKGGYEPMTPKKLLQMAEERGTNPEKKQIAAAITKEINEIAKENAKENGENDVSVIEERLRLTDVDKDGCRCFDKDAETVVEKCIKTVVDNDVEEEGYIGGFFTKITHGRRRAFATAATVIFVIAIVGSVAGLFADPVDADKSSEKYVEAQGDRVVIMDGGEDKGSNIERVSQVTENWNDVSKQRAYLPQLLIPEYIPDGFEFVQLGIEKDGKNYCVSYQFATKNDKSISILQQSNPIEKNRTTVVEKYDEEFEIDGSLTHISYYAETEYIVMVCYNNREKYTISGNITKEEAVEIIEGLK